MRKTILFAASPLVVAGVLAAGPVVAADTASNKSPAPPHEAQKIDPQKVVSKATDVVYEMKKDSNLVQLMRSAKGIFIVPKYAKGGLFIGAQGGTGVVLAHRNGTWTDPVFYDTGGFSFGLQAGVAAGATAMLLMSDRAVNRFRDENKFALNAEAGVSVVKYSANGQATPGRADVIVWSDTAGAYLGAALSITDVHRDNELNKAYYGEVISGGNLFATNHVKPEVRKLKSALP